MKYDRFEQLQVWQAAIDLARRVYALTAKREFRGQRSLRDQIERAAVSVSNNIAEGFERGTTQELLTFLYIARGSAGEVRSMLCLIEGLPGFGNLKSEISDLKSRAEGISRQLRGWADYKGHRIPAGAVDGSVNWVRMDDVPVEGRLMVIEKQQGVASSYDCNTCVCPAGYTGLSVAPAPSFDASIGSSTQASSTGAYEDCNSTYYYDETTASAWTSSNTSAFTMSPTTSGLAYAVAAGSSTISAAYTGELWYYYSPAGADL